MKRRGSAVAPPRKVVAETRKVPPRRRALSGVSELIRQIREANPTGRSFGADKTIRRYAEKSRLQAELIRDHSEDLDVVVEHDDFVLLRYRLFREHACHAKISELPDDARRWVYEQLAHQEQQSAALGATPKESDVAPKPVELAALTNVPQDNRFVEDGTKQSLVEQALAGFDYETARTLLEVAHQQAPADAGITLQLLDLLVNTLGLDQAASEMEIAPQVSKIHSVLCLRALALARLGRDDEAFALLKDIVDKAAREPLLVLFQRAIAQQLLGPSRRYLARLALLETRVIELPTLAAEVEQLEELLRTPAEAALRETFKQFVFASQEMANALRLFLFTWPSSAWARRTLREVEFEQSVVEVEGLLERAELIANPIDRRNLLRSIVDRSMTDTQRSRWVALSDKSKRDVRHIERELVVADLAARLKPGRSEADLLAWLKAPSDIQNQTNLDDDLLWAARKHVATLGAESLARALAALEHAQRLGADWERALDLLEPHRAVLAQAELAETFVESLLVAREHWLNLEVGKLLDTQEHVVARQILSASVRRDLQRPVIAHLAGLVEKAERDAAVLDAFEKSDLRQLRVVLSNRPERVEYEEKLLQRILDSCELEMSWAETHIQEVTDLDEPALLWAQDTSNSRTSPPVNSPTHRFATGLLVHGTVFVWLLDQTKIWFRMAFKPLKGATEEASLESPSNLDGNPQIQCSLEGDRLSVSVAGGTRGVFVVDLATQRLVNLELPAGRRKTTRTRPKVPTDAGKQTFVQSGGKWIPVTVASSPQLLPESFLQLRAPLTLAMTPTDEEVRLIGQAFERGDELSAQDVLAILESGPSEIRQKVSAELVHTDVVDSRIQLHRLHALVVRGDYVGALSAPPLMGGVAAELAERLLTYAALCLGRYSLAESILARTVGTQDWGRAEFRTMLGALNGKPTSSLGSLLAALVQRLRTADRHLLYRQPLEAIECLEHQSVWMFGDLQCLGRLASAYLMVRKAHVNDATHHMRARFVWSKFLALSSNPTRRLVIPGATWGEPEITQVRLAVAQTWVEHVPSSNSPSA